MRSRRRDQAQGVAGGRGFGQRAKDAGAVSRRDLLGGFRREVMHPGHSTNPARPSSA